MNRGLTLVETIMVVVLLSLVLTAIAGRFSAMSDAARLRSAGSQIRDLDARARLLAQSEGPVRLDASTMRVVSDRDGTILLSREVPASIRVDLYDDRSQRLDSVWYDGRGRSADHRIVVSLGANALAWDVAGLTGWFAEARR